MDCDMPGMDGFEAAQEIQKLIENEEIEPIQIFALTGYNDDTISKKCFAAGMRGVLTKPIETDKLMDLLGKEKKSKNKMSIGTSIQPRSESF